MDAHSDETIQAEIQRLLRGVAQSAQVDMYEAHRALYLMGAAALPDLEQAVAGHDYSKLDHVERIRMVSALIGVIHDIDEALSRQIVDRIIKSGCHPAIRSALNSICRFSINGYAEYRVLGLKILQSNDVDPARRVELYLDRWLRNVPARHLQEIERLYVVTQKEGMEYSGQYMPILTDITLVWRKAERRGNPLSWFYRLLIEHTLYHEIGHHFHRHSFGQDAEQERQANRYAARLLKRAHPVIFRTVRPLIRALRWSGKRFLRFLENRLLESPSDENQPSATTKQ